MTREEREFAKSRIEYLLIADDFLIKHDREALEMAIKALSQEPTFDDECQKDMDEAWEQIQKKRKRIPVTLDLTPCDDVVSRQAILDGIEELKKSPWATANRSHGYEYLITEALDVVKDLCIKQLPSVTQKSGKWINKEFKKEEYFLTGKCSVCGRVRVIDERCSHCGAKMESEDKE